MAEADDFVKLERDGHLAVVTLNRPSRRNAFGLAMRLAFQAQLTELMKEEDPCRVIVLTGAEGTFCAGGDISEMKQRTALDVRQRNELVIDIFRRMVAGPKPIVAAVEGAAMGAGLALVAACDYVVAAANSRYGAAFTKMGLLPDTGAIWSLGQKLGAGKAKELMMLASDFDGRKALEIGLANQMVEAGGTLAAATEVAQRLAQMPPVTVAMLKAALANDCDTLERTLETEANLQPLLRRSADHIEAIAAFMEKRRPVFVGR